MKKVVISISCLLFLVGCNGNSSSSNSNDDIMIIKVSNLVELKDENIKVEDNQSDNIITNVKEDIVNSSDVINNVIENNNTNKNSSVEEIVYIKNRLTLRGTISSPNCIKPNEPIDYLSATFTIDKNIEIDKTNLNLGVMVEPVSKNMLLKFAMEGISLYSENKKLNIDTNNSLLVVYAEDKDDNIFSISKRVSDITSITENNDTYDINFNIAINSDIASKLTFPTEEEFIIVFGVKEDSYNLEFVNFQTVQIGNILGIDLSNAYGFTQNFSVTKNCN